MCHLLSALEFALGYLRVFLCTRGQNYSFMQALQLSYAPTQTKICYRDNLLAKYNLFRVLAKHIHCLKQKLLCYFQWNGAKKIALNSILCSQGRLQCKHKPVNVPGALRSV